MSQTRSSPWDVRVEHCVVLPDAGGLGVTLLLTNRSGVAAIPDARQLSPTLRCSGRQPLAVSDIFRTQDALTAIYRPVIQPSATVQVYLRFPYDAASGPTMFLGLFGHPDEVLLRLPLVQ